ncbi:MAG: hypothetical protein ACYS18_07180 [Planctomycetota bacterium]|jgi:hypothetical protein
METRKWLADPENKKWIMDIVKWLIIIALGVIVFRVVNGVIDFILNPSSTVPSFL